MTHPTENEAILYHALALLAVLLVIGNSEWGGWLA